MSSQGTVIIDSLKALGEKDAKKLRRKQLTIFWALFVTYVGIYFCRANITIASTLFFDSEGNAIYPQIGSKTELGVILTTGTIVYSSGKALSGLVVQVFGHKNTVLMGCIGAAFWSLLFAFFKNYWALLIVWSLNRFFQSFVWSANMQFIREWYFKTDHGKVTSTLCLSFLGGDAFARLVLSGLVARDWSYQGLFVFGTIILAVLVVLDAIVLTSYPTDVNLPTLDEVLGQDEIAGLVTPSWEPMAPSQSEVQSTSTAYLSVRDEQDPRGVLPLLRKGQPEKKYKKSALRSVLSVPAFYVISLLSIGVTFGREAFRDWGPLMFKDVSGMEDATAGFWSTVYPFGGAVTTILCGWLSDMLPGRRRGGFLVVFMFLATISMSTITYYTWDITPENIPGDVPDSVMIVLVTLIGMCLYGPFTILIYLSLDWCPKDSDMHPNSVPYFIGLTDAIGYFAGALSGTATGALVDEVGWGSAMLVLTCVTGATVLVAVGFYFMEQKRVQAEIDLAGVQKDQEINVDDLVTAGESKSIQVERD